MENCLMHVVVITFVHTNSWNRIPCLCNMLGETKSDSGSENVSEALWCRHEVRCPLICGSGMFLSADPLGPVGCWVDAPWIRLVLAHSADWNLGRLESK